MSIETRFTPAIRNALLEKMQDTAGDYAAGGKRRETADNGYTARPGTDSVSLSADALRIHASITMTAGQGIFDAGRVAEIRQAIASGMYRIDPDRIAEKFYRLNMNM